jgi:hypothetical protein
LFHTLIFLKFLHAISKEMKINEDFIFYLLLSKIKNQKKIKIKQKHKKNKKQKGKKKYIYNNYNKILNK